jgi:Domain of unknown function (DUF4282)
MQSAHFDQRTFSFGPKARSGKVEAGFQKLPHAESPSIDRCNCEVHCAARRESRAISSGGVMFGLGDLFQWERFVTPVVIKVFYWLAVVISLLLGFAGGVSSLTTMAYNPFVGMVLLIVSVLGACMGIVLARIVAEFVLIVFRINEHLGAIRNQGTGLRNQ